MSQNQHICVCVCTYKRPKQLDRLLYQLERQDTEGLFDHSIVIVDNDAHESARLIVESHSVQPKVAIIYDVEPRQNIALARNKAIENASGDFIAFIDDDELPDSRWLIVLYKAIKLRHADGVLGPVLPRFEVEPPKWVLESQLFDRPSYVSGHVLDWQNTRTGNVLLKAALFKGERTWFRPEFGSGGEDRDFFKRKIGDGNIFVWCQEAPVFETVPPGRWEKKVLLKRALLRGKMTLCSTQAQLKSVLVSCAAAGIYITSLPFLYVFSRVIGYGVFMRYLIKSCDHIGKILAFMNIDLVKEKYVS